MGSSRPERSRPGVAARQSKGNALAALLRRGQFPVLVQRVIVAGFLLVAVDRIMVFSRHDGDFRLYTWTGEAALARTDLYHGCPWGACTWPPVFSLGCIPLAVLARWSEPGVRAIWLLVNGAALAWIVRLLAAWAYPGARWRWWPERGAVSPGSVECALPLLLCGRFLLVNAEFLQVNLLILLCELAGLWGVAQRRDAAGGVLIGLAGALKVLPWLLIPWLFWRGRRTAAVAAAASGLGWTVLPGLYFGWQPLAALLRDWPRAVGEGWGVNGPNQSVAAMLDRFVGHGVTPGNAGSFPFAFVPGSGSPIVPWLALLAAVAVVAAAAFAWRRPLRLASAAGAAEAGAVIGASVLFSPLAWVHYFVAFLVPAAGSLAVIRKSRAGADNLQPALTMLAAAAAVIWLTSRTVAGSWLSKVGLSLSVLTLAGGLLAAGAGWAAARGRA